MAQGFLLILLQQVVWHATIPALRGVETLEGEVVQWVNALRLEAGVPPLQVATDLTACARWTSSLLKEVQRLTHELPFDSARTLKDRLYRCGILDQEAGENLYMLWVPRPDYAPSGRGIAEQWRESPEHRENLLDPEFTHTGVGVVLEGNTWWVTQLYVVRDLVPPRLVLDTVHHRLRYRARVRVPHTAVVLVGNLASDTFHLRAGDTLRLDLPLEAPTCIRIGTPLSPSVLRIRQAFCVDPLHPPVFRPFR
jgi:hypothetical protein